MFAPTKTVEIGSGGRDRRENEMIGYQNKHGQVLFVSAGLGGDNFATYVKKPNGGVRRFRSKLLPVRKEREQAEYDLRKYAKITGMHKVELPEDYRINRTYTGIDLRR